jgi:hypothetical protein
LTRSVFLCHLSTYLALANSGVEQAEVTAAGRRPSVSSWNGFESPKGLLFLPGEVSSKSD